MATKKKSVLILDQEQIFNKLRRMAYEIWEHNSAEKEITLVGIEGGGKIVAESLSAILKKISPLKVKNVTLSINKKNPLNNAIDFNEDLTGKCVILVDDVVNSGKTIFYSLTAILAYDLKKMMIAVLVDRKHKNFPIASDIVGHSIATTVQEHIEVETEGKEIVAAYLE